MICPKCKTEYREGFYRCADCDINLVEESQDTQDSFEASDSLELVPALETKDSSFLSDVVALIEEQNIPYLLQSGTAIGLESDSNDQVLEWRAALYAFPNSLEAIKSILEKVHEDRRNRSSDTQELEE